MTSVTKSPFVINEILYLICTFVDCEDLRTLSRCSHHLYLVARPILEHHRIMWARFQSLEDDEHTSSRFWHYLTISLLTTVSGAPYIRHLKWDDHRDRAGSNREVSTFREIFREWDIHSEVEILIPCENPQEFPKWPVFKKIPISELSVIEDHIQACEWFSYLEKADLVKGIQSGKQPYIRAVLLLLLPNLKTLRVESSSSKLQHHLGTAVRYAAVSHSLNNRCYLFSKLVSVDFTSISGSMVGYELSRDEYSLEFLSNFMALPSLRKLAVGMVEAEDFTREGCLQPSNATDIAIYQQDISAQAFRNLLADGSPLESIKLLVNANPQYFDDAEFVEVLLETSKHSLEHLELLHKDRRHTWFTTTSGFQSIRGIQLQQFSKLKDVIINHEILQFRNGEGMAHVFPASLQNLELHTVGSDNGAWEEIPLNILHMLDCKKLFPNWSELSIVGESPKLDKSDLAIACENQGVNLRIVDPVKEMEYLCLYSEMNEYE